jgi:Ca2+-binding RTX toxin-like protein
MGSKMRVLKIGVITALLISSAGFTGEGASAAILTCAGKTVTIAGNNASNKIIGTPGADVIHGLGGSDIIKGGGGNDTICGGDGNDRIWGGNGKDRIYGGRGNDVIRGGNGSDTMFGSSGRDLLDGGPDGGVAYGGSYRDACYRATTPDGSRCDRDQVNIDGASNIEASDLLSLTNTNSGLYNRAYSGASVDGKFYRRGIGCYHYSSWGMDSTDDCSSDFILGRNYRRFASRIGVLDVSVDPDVVVKFEVIGDGSIIATRTVAYGQIKALNVDVRNVLRLELRISAINSDSSGKMYFAWLDPRISANERLYAAGPL